MQKEGIFISQFENTFIIYRANLHPEQLENERLKDENYWLRLENAYLKN